MAVLPSGFEKTLTEKIALAPIRFSYSINKSKKLYI